MVNPMLSFQPQNILVSQCKQCLKHHSFFFSAGFKVSNTSCCNVDSSIGGLCLPNSKLCSNRSDYVFWDAFHPSDKANAILGEEFFSLLFSAAPSIAPTPSNWSHINSNNTLNAYGSCIPIYYLGKPRNSLFPAMSCQNTSFSDNYI